MDELCPLCGADEGCDYPPTTEAGCPGCHKTAGCPQGPLAGYVLENYTPGPGGVSLIPPEWRPCGDPACPQKTVVDQYASYRAQRGW
jgi:hypothetical protein